MVDRGVIQANIKNCLTDTDFISLPGKRRGKVRDTYDLGDTMVLVTTDRQSAFDRILASIPFKGQVLNQVSAFWFETTKDIIPNHVIATPDPNVTVGKKCSVLPIEMVVRGYLTGSTGTSIWKNYERGARVYCGHTLPDGLKKNVKLAKNLVTPTTKSDEHDELISADEIVSRGIIKEAVWKQMESAALALFARGQELAAKNGLILVDTKYEMGLDADGRLLLIDEIHTPDSSRYWLKDSYESRIRDGKEPENIDKEFLRLWFVDHCDPYNDPILPDAPDELVIELSARYIQLYEMITGRDFKPAVGEPIKERIMKNLKQYAG
ncbi:MAG: phosphoribosylaminoimidazolesuccinocarboxamide synthase [Planctomycetota bacterium]